MIAFWQLAGSAGWVNPLFLPAPLAIAVAISLFVGMLVCLELGYRLGRYAIEKTASSHEGTGTIEAAVFALLGLLLGFTFANGISHLDRRRELIVQEANSIATAYLRLDLLPPPAQPALRQLFRDYTTSRLGLYNAVSEEISPATEHLQREIWQQSVAAAAAPGASADAVKLPLPSLNAMIDITSTRQNAFYMHPPSVVFLLLFAFSCGAAFLAGYSLTAHGRSWFYMVAFAVAVTATVYATLEVEYPRQGLIRFTHMDEPLIRLRSSMN